MSLFQELTRELVASGIVGLVMAGIVARGAIMGFIEARTKMKEIEKAASTAPSIAITSAIWDKNQIERFLQIMERIAEVMENQVENTAAIAKAQGILSDSFQQSTHSKLNELLHRLEDIKPPNTRVTRPNRR